MKKVMERRITDSATTYNPFYVQVGGVHYKKHTIQPIDFIEANKLSFAEGCVIKYIMRYKEKNGIEDLKKAKHYIDLIMNNYTDGEK